MNLNFGRYNIRELRGGKAEHGDHAHDDHEDGDDDGDDGAVDKKLGHGLAALARRGVLDGFHRRAGAHFLNTFGDHALARL